MFWLIIYNFGKPISLLLCFTTLVGHQILYLYIEPGKYQLSLSTSVSIMTSSRVNILNIGYKFAYCIMDNEKFLKEWKNCDFFIIFRRIDSTCRNRKDCRHTGFHRILVYISATRACLQIEMKSVVMTLSNIGEREASLSRKGTTCWYNSRLSSSRLSWKYKTNSILFYIQFTWGYWWLWVTLVRGRPLWNHLLI